MVMYYICEMIKRKTIIQVLLKEFPAVVILGPRQVGKSTLAKEALAKTKKPTIFLDMELNSDRAKLEDAETYFELHRDKRIIIDEVQLMPSIFTVLRPEIDAYRKPGRFILTGSANPTLIKDIAETLAGRVAYMPLTPFTIDEVVGTKYSLQRHWFRGGYPDAFLAKSDEAYHRWMENYIETFVQRDLQKLFDINLSPQLTRSIWTMIANNNGGILNTENYARAVGVSSPTVKKYLNFLEGAFLIRQLQPWYYNADKRMVKSPKIYIRDTGVLHHFTNISNMVNLTGNITIGASWEGYVIEEIIRHLPPSIDAYYYRTHHGAEADLILAKNNKPVACLEVKHSKSPVVSSGFYNVIEDLATTQNFIIYTGEDKYFTKNKILVVGLIEFIAKELKKVVK